MFWQNAHAGTIALPQASTIAPKVDMLYDFLFWLSVVLLICTTFAVLLFAKKYHRSQKGRETAYILGSHTLELLWTITPLVLMLAIFAWGYMDYLTMRAEVSNPTEINVVGRQWFWNFEYANGRKTMNELVVPNGKPVKLIMTAEDVLHSVYIPNFRIKQDVVPGQYTTLSFVPTLVGEHPLYCTEFCGTGHSDMLAKVFVVEPEDYEKWLVTGKLSGVFKETSGASTATAVAQPMKSLAEQGADLFNSKGCTACHAVDGTKKIGPALNGIFGHEQDLEKGGPVKVDENYIRQSLMDPQSQIVKGYPPSMPTFKGLLNDQEVNALVAYIKSLK